MFDSSPVHQFDNQTKETSTEAMSERKPLTQEEVKRLLHEAAPGVRELGRQLRRVFAPADWRKRLR